MGLLDELRSEAERRKLELDEQRRQSEQLETSYRETLAPALRRIFEYLTELLETIDFLKPNVRVDFPISEYGTLQDLGQEDYILTADSIDRMTKIQLRFVCVGSQRLSFTATPPSVAHDLRELLMDHGLKFHSSNYYDDFRNPIGERFDLEPRVPGRVIADADIQRTLIRLSLINFDGPVVHRALYRPEQIDDNLLDDLGSYILRKNQNLTRLFLPEETRLALRSKVEEEQRSRTHGKLGRGSPEQRRTGRQVGRKRS